MYYRIHLLCPYLRGATIKHVTVYRGISIQRFDFQYTILHRGTILSIPISVNRANWFQNDVVKMASGSVKRSVDCATDSRDLQISKMKSFGVHLFTTRNHKDTTMYHKDTTMYHKEFVFLPQGYSRDTKRN
jgi:hypothetical protein